MLLPDPSEGRSPNSDRNPVKPRPIEIADLLSRLYPNTLAGARNQSLTCIQKNRNSTPDFCRLIRAFLHNGMRNRKNHNAHRIPEIQPHSSCSLPELEIRMEGERSRRTCGCSSRAHRNHANPSPPITDEDAYRIAVCLTPSPLPPSPKICSLPRRPYKKTRPLELRSIRSIFAAGPLGSCPGMAEIRS